MRTVRIISSTALLVGLSALAAGCCGDLTRTPDVRKAFVDKFNDKQDLGGCKLEGKGDDLSDLILTCNDQTVAWMEGRVKPVCSSYQPFGFKTMKAVGSDGTSDVAVGTDCHFTPVKAAENPS